MHIYFLGIGGTGIGPLALIAKQAGFTVSGSDARKSDYTEYLSSKGIEVSIETSADQLKELHSKHPVDWIVGVSAIIRNTPNEEHLKFAKQAQIKVTERDELLSHILTNKNLKLIAISGTHGKTTTTAMVMWLMAQCGEKISYSVGAKTDFSDMGHYDAESKYFIYECDEFHRNFLHFYPYRAIISGIAWDHHEIFPTKEEYNSAFRQFISQSDRTVIWEQDASYAGVISSETIQIMNERTDLSSITLPGLYNRRDAWLAVSAVHELTRIPIRKLINYINQFPGTHRRMEQILPGLYSDYAHTPEKIIGCMSIAKELAESSQKKVVVVYEPLTNRRQYFVKENYKDCFNGADEIFWVPSYLARESPEQKILSPEELLTYVSQPALKYSADLDDTLWQTIQTRLKNAIVVCMSGGGGGSLDEWIRAKVQALNR